MSSILKPTKIDPPGQHIKPRAILRPNISRLTRDPGERRLPARIGSVATNPTPGRALSGKQISTIAASRTQCPNKSCPKPNVVEGTCQTCGRVGDDSNIVSEISFGETSSGAAIVQGSYVGADQAGVRSLGPNFRRVGPSDDREMAIREARQLMQGFAHQLNLSESLVNSGVQAFKLAHTANFVQGRTTISVAAVCLYAACRIAPPCKIMLLDLADLIQTNVFRLGRIFKALNKQIPICNDGLTPVFPEDLIYRFATKLEFQEQTTKVAEDAVRLVKRMRQDWMILGRRPSGICGACLLMAARMNNFRRTVREVVYIVKVTNHTIQRRLQEFATTESSGMSVEDFLSQDFLESAHDPPAFYQQTEEYRAKLQEKSRKRKRRVTDDVGAEQENTTIAALSEDAVASASSTALNNPPADGSQAAGSGNGPLGSPDSKAPGSLAAPPDLSSVPVVEYRRDTDGFIIPPLPNKDIPGALSLVDPNSVGALEDLAENYGESTTQGGPLDLAPAAKQTGKKTRSKGPAMPIDEEWVQDEENLEAEISDIFNDPNTMAHAVAYSNAQQRAHLHAAWARSQLPQKDISMAADIHEDEFADDPEVVNCLLNPEEQKFKELCWSNENRDWLRQQQEKVYRLKLAADQPKQTRRRKKRPRIGEGQTSPASTPAEAAINVIKERAWSKRINYDAIRSLFDVDNGGPGSMMGSAATSRQTSYAGSAIGHDDAAEDDDETDDSGPGDDDEGPGSPDVSDEEVYDADGYDDDNGFEEPEDDLHED